MNEVGKWNGDFAMMGNYAEEQFRGNNSRPHLPHKDCHNKWNGESNQMKKRLQANNDGFFEIYNLSQRNTHGFVAVDNDKTGIASL